MGSVINIKDKHELLLFIESNFGKISQREIARRLNIGKTTVNRWCKEKGLFYKKHTSNEKFFDKWNETSAYVLGFIFADGNVSWNPRKSYRSLTITSSEKDEDHLEKIRKFLSCTKPLLYSDRTKSFRLIAVNKNLCRKLMKLGVIPKKSLIVDFPKVPKKYLRHFIRGVIDGDGSVNYFKRERSPYFAIRIVSGSQTFLEKLVKRIKKEINITSKVKRVHGNTFQVSYTCKRAKGLATWIYKDANIFLNRKFKNYLIMKKLEVVVPGK